jgi:hypothetical protein
MLAKALTIDPAVIQRLRELPKPEKVECLLALGELTEIFGQPHIHSGLAIASSRSAISRYAVTRLVFVREPYLRVVRPP